MTRRFSIVLAVLAVFAFLPAAGAHAAAGRDLPDFTELYEKQGPAVVSIDVTQKVRQRGMPEISEDDPFYEFFRRFGQIPRRDREFQAQSVGSGFIVGEDGYIITNAHVVDAADEVNVKLSDKREFKAKVVGADRRTDVAVLKIDATRLPTVTVGDANKLRVGEWVVAIGKPFGLENTMTAGIVSAKGRDLPQENLVPFIQTDVAINPGNSGGPLFNMNGEVVGINSLIFSRTGGYMGLAFAIPIDVAMNVVQQIREKGRVTRGRIGVQIQEVTRETAEAFGLAQPTGALVNSVVKGGPADKGGVQAGDIILKVNGRDVESSAELPRVITMIRPGTTITLTVWRKGAPTDIKVVVDELKEDGDERGQRGAAPAKPEPNRMGLIVSDLTEEQKRELGVKNGVVVEEIPRGTRANIQVGDVILEVVSQGVTTEIRSREQLERLLAKLDKNTSVTLKLRRGDNQFYSSLRVNGE